MVNRVTFKPPQKNVNKLSDINIRSVILIELVVLQENKWTKTFSMLIFSFSSVREQSRYTSIDGPKFCLELKQLLFPLIRLNTVGVQGIYIPFNLIVGIHVMVNWQLSKKVSTGQCHMTVSRDQVYNSFRWPVWGKLSAYQLLVLINGRIRSNFSHCQRNCLVISNASPGSFWFSDRQWPLATRCWKLITLLHEIFATR